MDASLAHISMPAHGRSGQSSRVVAAKPEVTIRVALRCVMLERVVAAGDGAAIAVADGCGEGRR